MLDHHDNVLCYWLDSLRAEELTLFQAEPGDPAFQAEWELLAFIVSLEVSRTSWHTARPVSK